MNKLAQEPVAGGSSSSNQVVSKGLTLLLLTIPVLAFILANRGSLIVYFFDGSTRTFIGHSDDVNSVAFSPNGRLVLSGARDKSMRLWDMKTGLELRSFKKHTNFINSVSFSPDGRFALSGSRDHNIRLWDVKSGR